MKAGRRACVTEEGDVCFGRRRVRRSARRRKRAARIWVKGKEGRRIGGGGVR